MSKSFDDAIERDAKSGALDRAIIRDTIKGLAETDQQAVLAIVDGMAAEIERLRAAVEESREAVKRSIDRLCAASQWKPIDLEAMKDGRQYVTCDSSLGVDGYEIGRYEPHMADRFVDAGDGLYRKEPVSIYDWTTFNNIHRATHYLPLPSPPTQEEGE